MVTRQKTIEEIACWLKSNKAAHLREIDSKSKSAIGKLESLEIEKELAREIYYYSGKNWELTTRIMSVIAPHSIFSKFSNEFQSGITELTKEEKKELMADLENMPDSGFTPQTFI